MNGFTLKGCPILVLVSPLKAGAPETNYLRKVTVVVFEPFAAVEVYLTDELKTCNPWLIKEQYQP